MIIPCFIVLTLSGFTNKEIAVNGNKIINIEKSFSGTMLSFSKTHDVVVKETTKEIREKIRLECK